MHKSYAWNVTLFEWRKTCWSHLTNLNLKWWRVLIGRLCKHADLQDAQKRNDPRTCLLIRIWANERRLNFFIWCIYCINVFFLQYVISSQAHCAVSVICCDHLTITIFWLIFAIVTCKLFASHSSHWLVASVAFWPLMSNRYLCKHAKTPSCLCETCLTR